jgi:hypothetical protein
MSDIEELRQEISKLNARNKRVEANKAWETSLTRKVILMLITYLVVGLTLTTIHNDAPWVNAIIPTLGFFLSTLSLPYLKDLWRKYIYKTS